MSSTLTKLRLLYLLNFVSNLQLTAVPWIFYLKSNGISLLQITILQATLNLGMMVFEIPTGILADKIGKVKSLLIAYLAFILDWMILLVFPGEFFILIFGFFLAGLGWALVSGSSEALIYDTASSLGDDKTKIVIGRFTAIGNWAEFVSLLSSGFLYSISHRLVFVLMVIFYVISFIIALFIKEDVQELGSHDELRAHVKDFVIVIKEQRRHFALLFLLATIIGIVSIYYVLSPQIFDEVALSPALIGIFFALSSGIEGVANIISHKIEKHFSLTRVLLCILILMGLCFAFLLYPQKLVYIVLFLGLSVLFGIVDPIIIRVINERFISTHRVALNSTFNSLSSIQMLVLIPLIGGMAEFFNVGIGIIIAYVGVVSIGILCGVLVRGRV